MKTLFLTIILFAQYALAEPSSLHDAKTAKEMAEYINNSLKRIEESMNSNIKIIEQFKERNDQVQEIIAETLETFSDRLSTIEDRLDKTNKWQAEVNKRLNKLEASASQK